MNAYIPPDDDGWIPALPSMTHRTCIECGRTFDAYGKHMCAHCIDVLATKGVALRPARLTGYETGRKPAQQQPKPGHSR